MERRIESVIFKGNTNKSLTVSYIFNANTEGKFKCIEEDEKGNIKLYPGYLIQINPGYPLPRIFISPRKYYTFTLLLEKSVKLIQKNLFDLFPNVNQTEFETDDRALERFQTEKALSGAGITIVPAVYVDSSNQCYPGLRISLEDKPDSVTIPLEDAMGISHMFKSFEPHTYGMTILSQLITIT